MPIATRNGNGPGYGFYPQLIEIWVRLRERGALTTAKWHEFFGRLSSVDCRHRKRVRTQDPVTLRFSGQSLFPFVASLTTIQTNPVRYADGIFRVLDSSGALVWERPVFPSAENAYWGHWTIPGNTLPPGNHMVEFRAKKYIDVHDDDGNIFDKSPIDEIARSQLTVLPVDQDVLTVNRDPALAEDFEKALNVGCCHDSTRPLHSCACPNLGAIGTPPDNAFFDIYLEIDGREYAVGSIELRLQTPYVVNRTISQGRAPVERCREVTVILRSDLDEARRSRHEYSTVWDGEFRFESIPVERRGY